MSANLQTAKTILSQLGGNKFLAMTGARDLTGSENSLSMRLPRNPATRITHIKVILDANDTYTVQAHNYNSRALTLKLIDSRDTVYADDLQRVFTDLTGFDTRL